jgi:hypothetical protein
MGKELPTGRTPADEVEFKRFFSRIRKALAGLRSDLRRKRNKNALWKF